MTFNNPRKVTVLTEHLDYYQWPCISGEDFPPTFNPGGSGVVAYATATTYPTVRVDQPGTAGVTASFSQWPSLPLSSPRTGVFNGYTLNLKFYIATLDVNNAKFGVFLDSASANGVEFNKTLSGVNGIKTFIGGVGTAGAGACPSLTTWHDLSMTVGANGLSIAFNIDGTVIRTATAGASIATFPPALTVISTNGGPFAVDAHVSQIKHSWS